MGLLPIFPLADAADVDAPSAAENVQNLVRSANALLSLVALSANAKVAAQAVALAQLAVKDSKQILRI